MACRCAEQGGNDRTRASTPLSEIGATPMRGAERTFPVLVPAHGVPDWCAHPRRSMMPRERACHTIATEAVHHCIRSPNGRREWNGKLSWSETAQSFGAVSFRAARRTTSLPPKNTSERLGAAPFKTARLVMRTRTECNSVFPRPSVAFRRWRDVAESRAATTELDRARRSAKSALRLRGMNRVAQHRSLKQSP